MMPALIEIIAEKPPVARHRLAGIVSLAGLELSRCLEHILISIKAQIEQIELISCRLFIAQRGLLH